MISKVSSFLVSDSKLYHFLRSKKFYKFLVSQKFLSIRNFCHISSNKHKYLSSFSVRPKMSTSINSESIFQGKGDRFEGITVISDLEPCNASEFQEKLKNSLTEWRNNKRRGIWFKVHLNQCDWVPILVKNGFKYHHAKEDYVMLYFWLPTNESNNVPKYAHTMIGVGAVVENGQNQILAVKEKYFYKVPMWKLPGGYVEPGENLVDAAIREVAEETGIRAQFESLLTLGHSHDRMFECSDIYIVVNLKALTDNITRCEREIAECQWIDIEEYLNHPHVHELNRFFVQKLLHHKKHNVKIDCHHGIHKLLKKPYTLYSLLKVDEEDHQHKPENGPLSFLSGGSSQSKI